MSTLELDFNEPVEEPVEEEEEEEEEEPEEEEEEEEPEEEEEEEEEVDLYSLNFIEMQEYAKKIGYDGNINIRRIRLLKELVKFLDK